MRSLALGFVIAGTILGCSTAPKPGSSSGARVQISDDCKQWENFDGATVVHGAYYKSSNSISYFDPKNKFYSVLTPIQAPFVFDYSEPGWVHLSSGQSLQSIRFQQTEDRNEALEMMSAILAAAGGVSRENRWVINPERKRIAATFIAAPCKAEPNAVGASCDPKSGECSLIPESLSKPGLAKKCLRELDLGSQEMIALVSKACERVVTSTDHLLKVEAQNKARVCDHLGIAEPPPAAKAADVCQALPNFFKSHFPPK